MPHKPTNDDRLPFIRRARREPVERGVVVTKLTVQTWHHGRFADAVKDFSFRARPKRVTTICGGTAGVRALLLRVLAGTKPYESGTITIDGNAIAPPAERVSTRGVVNLIRFVGLRADVRELADPSRLSTVFVEEPFAGIIERDDHDAIAARLATLANIGHTVLITDGTRTEIVDAEQRLVSLSSRRPASGPNDLAGSLATSSTSRRARSRKGSRGRRRR